MMPECDQLAFLAEAGRTLGDAADLDASLARVARQFTGPLADLCLIDLLDAPPRRVAVAVANPARAPEAEALRRYPPGPANPIAAALARGDEVVAGRMTDDLKRQIARDDQHAAIIDAMSLQWILAAPIVARGRTLGMITLARAEPGEYAEVDKCLLRGVAERAAAAVDNALLHAAESEARERAELARARTTRLQRVTAGLAGALAPQQVAHIILDDGLRAIGAAAGVVTGLDESGTALDVLGFVGYDPAVYGSALVSVPLKAHLPLVVAYRTAEPVFVANRAAWASRYAGIVLSEEHKSWAALPLVVGREIIGSIGISYAEERSFDADERAFLAGLAGLCAQSLHRARLYAAERTARAAAEEAVRVREDFLSIAAHELRTPLTPLLLQLGLLRREFEGSPAVKKVELALRQTERLSRLATNLLDVARVNAGSFAVERAEVDLAEVARAVAERHDAEAQRGGVRIEVDALPVRGMWDGLRLEQVVTNLVTNALRHAGGKPVRIGVRSQDGRALLSVSDEGDGITEEAMAVLFQRFARVSTDRLLGGLGLGLYISRQIAEALGGTLTVESVEGKGATFTLELPGVLGEPALN